jgi:hypothetical protein
MGHAARVAGEGLDTRIREGYEWRWFYLFGLAAGGVVLAIVAMVSLLAGGKTPWSVLLLVAAGMVAPVGLMSLRERGALRRLTMGLEGERTVGGLLGDLGRMGYVVRHDLEYEYAPGKTANIDHVVIGPAGVIVVETKNRTKPAKGRAVVRFDGKRIRVGDGPWDGKPVWQVEKGMEEVRRRLRAAGVRDDDVPVRGVVAVSGMVGGAGGGGQLLR